MDVDGCGWIWINVDGCGWMWMNVDERGQCVEDRCGRMKN